jgi:hypothetical protein
VLLCALPAARATINCTQVTSPGITMLYASNTQNAVQSTFTVSCTRGNNGDPQSQAYTVTVDDGANFNLSQNRARFTFFINFYVLYELYSTAACNPATLWQGAQGITDTITWPPNQIGTLTKQTTFWACVPPQTSYGTTYSDLVTMTLTQGGLVKDTGTFPVSITSPSNCSFSTPPGAIAITYTAFGAPQVLPVPFGVRCSAGVGYTLTLDPLGDVLNGVRYTAVMPGGGASASGTGTGNPQNYTITVTVPGGQAGQCVTGSCTAARLHTVTITY